MSVDEHTIELAGSPVFYRRAPRPGSAGREPLYLHGIPTSSDDWTAFLERTGGVAPDLIGFGRSGKGGHLDYSLDGYAQFIEQFLDYLRIDRVEVVAHQWGAAAAMVFAQRNRHRIGRLVLIDPVPLTVDFTWPPALARLRRPLLGELVMGSVPKRSFAKLLRTGGRFSDERVDELWEQFDQGTQRAILRIVRGTDDHVLTTAGADLAQVDIPALILGGELDPWLPADTADSYAKRLPNATPARIAGARHWPWHDDPTVVARVITFLQQTDRHPQP
ncbi:MAG TPA: alpha/beta hydrolase [Solirubrobacteraceae bacterium]